MFAVSFPAILADRDVLLGMVTCVGVFADSVVLLVFIREEEEEEVMNLDCENIGISLLSLV